MLAAIPGQQRITPLCCVLRSARETNYFVTFTGLPSSIERMIASNAPTTCSMSAVVTGNGADQHWTLDEGPAYTGGVNGQFPIGPWVLDNNISRWITPTSNAKAGSYARQLGIVEAIRWL